MTEPAVRTVDWYIDRALIRSGAPSDRTLGVELGLSPNSLTNYRTRRAWPSDQAMIRLAELAGIDPDVALMDLNAWRAKAEDVRDRYTNLARMLEKAGVAVAVAIVAIVGIAFPAETKAEQNDVSPVAYVHYGKWV